MEMVHHNVFNMFDKLNTIPHLTSNRTLRHLGDFSKWKLHCLMYVIIYYINSINLSLSLCPELSQKRLNIWAPNLVSILY